MKEAIDYLSTKRFYVFLADGTWFTCSNEQWKEDQVWKLKPIHTDWVGGDSVARVIEAVIKRFNND